MYEYLSTALSKYDLEKVGTVVLGCTHFNYFKESFVKVFPHRPHFVDGNEGTVRQAMRLLGYNNIDTNYYNQKHGLITYLFSGKAASIEDMQKIERCMTQLDKMMKI